MFPDIGGGLAEAIFIVVLALIVVGPRDLPKVLYTLGRWTGKAQALAAEFRAGIGAIARTEELKQDLLKQDAQRREASDLPPPAAPMPSHALPPARNHETE